MLNKERAVDMYRLSAYFLAITTSDLPLDLFLPVIFLLIVYFMAGLRENVAPFFLSMLTVFLSIVTAQGLGLVIGASLMNIKKATTLASVTVTTFMLDGGYFIKSYTPSHHGSISFQNSHMWLLGTRISSSLSIRPLCVGMF